MSCALCQKKFGLLHRKAGKEGRCWSCLKAACAGCAPLYDGTDLGWVAPHHVCGVCASQLDRQKAKMNNQQSLSSTTTAERQANEVATTMEQIPDWSLPPTVTAPATALPSHVLAVGATRDDAKRASRVLLRTVIENMKDRGSEAELQKSSVGDERLSSCVVIRCLLFVVVDISQFAVIAMI
jgi:hypothetical protein